MPKNRQADSFFASQTPRFWLWVVASVVGFSGLLGGVLIYEDAFEQFYEFSREHEDWNLDDLAVALVATLTTFAMVGMVVVVSVSRRLMRAQAARQQAEQQLAQSRHLVALGTMVAGTAHSINNHLMPIIALADLVRSELPAHSEHRQDLDKVVSAARSAADIVARMKTFARTNHVVQGECDIAAVTRTALQLAQQVVPTSTQWAADVAPLAHRVALAPSAWEIVVLNLVSNAVDALQGKPGSIAVSLKTVPAPAGASARSATGATIWMEFQVSDSGEGMGEDVKSRLFDPFFTTKPVGKGTGLGLPESLGIVEGAGGHFEVSSTPGQGTHMKVLLPVLR